APSKSKDAAYEFIKYLTDKQAGIVMALEGRQSPANQSVYADAKVAADPVLKSFHDQVEVAVPMPNLPEMTMVWSPATTVMNSVTRHAASPKAALDAAEAAIPSVSQARVFRADGIRLEASTAPDDVGDRAAPRRLRREEKPLYDRSQRIAAAVQTNREEQRARKPEIEVAPAGARLSLAGPLEKSAAVVGIVEIETAAQPVPKRAGWSGFLLALIAPVAVFGVLAFLL